MPEALATTKRKFHKLLDSRFGTPPPSPAGIPNNPKSGATDSRSTLAEPAAKRIRSDASTVSLATSLRKHNASTLSVASVRTTASTKTVNIPPQPTREPPNFSPWSHDTFLARLKTFSRVTLWHPKPEAVNEVEWAKRGWSCVDTNTVCCKGGCSQRLLVNVEPVVRRRHLQEEQKVVTETGGDAANDHGGASDNQEEEEEEEEGEEEVDSEGLEKALVERYTDLIIQGHGEGCLWRQVGCKDDIYRLPIVKSTVWQTDLRDHFASLIKIANSIRAPNLKPDLLKPSPEQLLADFPSTLLAAPESSIEREDDSSSSSSSPSPVTDTHSVRPKALLIAVCGWRGVTESGNQLLCCDACFQRIGLWMYQPDYKQASHSNDDEDDEESQDRALDLVDLHREHCPWRNAASQSAAGDYAGLPAWTIFHNILARYADEHRRRSKDQNVPVAAVSEVEGEPEEHAGELELMPELTREETAQLDKERTSRLRKLKKVFGFKTRVPPAA